ncbi:MULTISPECIES: hypothetical protein [unclassified Campylobacter]|uniref:hypothetical protein n=1 Tax=unclassified Campylobacter TaxID=2593542 RepID=UPI0022E9D72F|nr:MULTISPECIES: hypothetical protein [unclassified Campylobacter]MBR2157594.1 hypothetical protein [Campylobacter sp.]MDA3064789.1 hypothetical protein [Campylobacter sp. CN_NE4]MDA3068387.1 hypothetical protein [Campylobacter sp. CN_NE3]MDA3082300.1 hypothetical protein [Campylobacter sp. CN_EL2]MDA3083935.1 hypothetical protein [Campylobacter sp. CN_NE1]
MALKDDIAGIKQEIGTEEQFLESIIKSELFIKKYKKPLLGLVAILVLGFVGYYGNLFFENKRIDSANALYNELLKNPNDNAKKDELKSKDINLYAVFELKNSLKNGDNAKLDELANLSNIDPLLKEIINLQNGKQGVLLEDYNSFINGYELLKSGKFDAAEVEFNKIPADSPFKQMVVNLKHYNG